MIGHYHHHIECKSVALPLNNLLHNLLCRVYTIVVIMSDARSDPNNNDFDSSPPARKHTCESPPKSQGNKRSRVAFEMADIIEFEPTLFTTTVTSGGIPVRVSNHSLNVFTNNFESKLGMSLKERSRVRRRLDSFEMERQQWYGCIFVN